ncbi:MAG: hypothetical protein MZV63_57815 [Marinilabiliales bacterium]|nr:hypothetical protein [Marinilabiliales bacterium]
MCEETIPFILIFVPLALSLGYDTIVGVAIPFLGAAAGFAGAFFNPFTVGIAQGLAGPASLFRPRLPADRLGGRDGHRHRRSSCAMLPRSSRVTRRPARPTMTTWRRSGSF